MLKVISGLRSLLRQRQTDRDLDAELRDFVNQSTHQKIREGIAPPEAARAARLELGSATLVRDRVADVGWESLLEGVWFDARYAFRTLRQTPTFTAVAVLTLALGIGANTAIFSIVNAVFLRELPYPQPQSLFQVQRMNNRAGGYSISPAIYVQWKTHGEVFEAMGVIAGARPMTLLSGGDPLSVQAATLSPGALAALAVQPQRGRLFEPEEERPGSTDVALISDSLWRTVFNRDGDIVGKVVTLNAAPVTIVGVMPTDFELPTPFTKSAQVWLPYRLPVGAENNASNGFTCIAKLRTGVSPVQASLALTPSLVTLSHQFPDFIQPTEQARLVPLRDFLRAGAGTAPLLLLGAVAFVLLIACVNIANLLLARAAARQREISVRVSLGASRSRILRQVLTESTLLGLLGAMAGVIVCSVTFDAILALVPSDLPYIGAIRIDRTVLAFALALGILTGLLFGIAPAVLMAKSDRSVVLKDGTARAGTSRERRRLTSALTVGEIALGLLLMIGAALMLESLSRLMRVDLGFDPGHVTTFTITLPRTYDTPMKRLAVYEDVREQLARRPGAPRVAYINGLPLSQGDLLFHVEGQTDPERAIGDARVRFTTPEYFEALRIPILSGRGITAQDSESSEPVIVINRSLAERFWPQGNAIGSFVWVGQPMGPAQTERTPRRIVGIVGDIRGYSVAGGHSDDMYEPAVQASGAGIVSFAIRSSEEPRALVPAISGILRTAFPDQAVAAIRTMDEIVATSASVNTHRFHAVLLGLFGGLGLLIVIVGVYGVASYAVAQRTQEFGVRVALGATPGVIRAMVLKDGFRLAAVGAVVGLLTAFALTRLLTSLLFDVQPNNPLTLAGASAVMIAVTLGASWIPARRATKVDPLVALRCE